MPAFLPALYWGGAALLAAYASACAQSPEKGTKPSPTANPQSKPINPKHYELRSILTVENGTLIDLGYDGESPQGISGNVSFFDQNDNQQLDENDFKIIHSGFEVSDKDGGSAVRGVTPEDIRSLGESSTNAFQMGFDHRQEMYNLIEGQSSGSCAYFKRQDRFSTIVNVRFDPPLSFGTRQVRPGRQYSQQEITLREEQGLTLDPAKCAKASESIDMPSILGRPLNPFRQSIMIQIGNRHLDLPFGNPLGLSNGAGLDVYYLLEGEIINTRMAHLDL